MTTVRWFDQQPNIIISSVHIQYMSACTAYTLMELTMYMSTYEKQTANKRLINIHVHAYNLVKQLLLYVWFLRHCISVLHVFILLIQYSDFTAYNCNNLLLTTFRWYYDHLPQAEEGDNSIAETLIIKIAAIVSSEVWILNEKIIIPVI